MVLQKILQYSTSHTLPTKLQSTYIGYQNIKYLNPIFTLQAKKCYATKVGIY